jgi:hypothetical protein
MTMPRRRRSPSTLLSRQLMETAIAAPQVVAHRVSRMATPHPTRARQDQQEFIGMWTEKQLAFTQSWLAMCAHTVRLGQQAMLAAWRAGPASTARLGTAWWQAPAAAVAIAQKGLAPVHRKAVSNAKRLAAKRR